MSAESRIPLYEELKLIEDYIELENMRFPDKFDYSINVSPELNIHAIEIPPFFIQPQVENAIRHGLLRKTTPGHLSVDIKKSGSSMRIIVEDNGIGRKAAAIAKSKETILEESKGMAIVEERLKQLQPADEFQPVKVTDLYGPSGEAAGTRVEILLPLEE
jgi:LytS/YehU family sensor histidine kinase